MAGAQSLQMPCKYARLTPCLMLAYFTARYMSSPRVRIESVFTQFELQGQQANENEHLD